MIGIVDYGMGNVRSVANALAYIGAESTVSDDAATLAECERLILPGVGAFGDAMQQIHRRGLDDVLHREVAAGKPLLGICLGMQLLAGSSEEHGQHEGLGFFEATVRRFSGPCMSGLKVPHMGWNNLEIDSEHPVLKGLSGENLNFYFVHSFHVNCSGDECVVASCEYGGRFTAIIASDNIVGVQFHPEKSQDNGIQVLQNFVNWRA
jgi:glutamine amidotransferase